MLGLNLPGIGGSDHPGRKDCTPQNGRKHSFISAPTLPTPNTTAQCQVSTVHSPEVSTEHSPIIQHHRSSKEGALGPLQVGGGQDQDPREQHREKAPGEPWDVMWNPSYGIEAAAVGGAITGPGYRAIPNARTNTSVGSWHRPAGRGSVNTSEGGECLMTKPGALWARSCPGTRNNRGSRWRGLHSEDSRALAY